VGDADSGIYALIDGTVGISRNATTILAVEAAAAKIYGFLGIGASASTPLASTGTIRLASGASIQGRNTADTADVIFLAHAGGDALQIGGNGAAGITARVSSSSTVGFTFGGSERVTLASAYIARGVNPAQNGAVRLENADAIAWRNAAGTASFDGLAINAANAVVLGADTIAAQEARVATSGYFARLINNVEVARLDATGLGVTGKVQGTSQGAAADYTVRKLGTGATDAAAGDDSRFAPAWATWTPTLFQGVTVGATITGARYVRDGHTVQGWCYLTVTGAGTAGQPWIVGNLPVVIASGASGMIMGEAYFYDASLPKFYSGLCTYQSATGVYSLLGERTSVAGADPNVALAAGDVVTVRFSYEIA
jgi:hypothetical protein